MKRERSGYGKDNSACADAAGIGGMVASPKSVSPKQFWADRELDIKLLWPNNSPGLLTRIERQLYVDVGFRHNVPAFGRHLEAR